MEYSKVSLFIIGTEITRGIIADKHGQLLARELSHLGYDVSRIIIVPDDGTLGDILRQCIQETDIVVITGGLGPTSDDMTRNVVASIAGVPLVQDAHSYADLYGRIGERIHGANQRQVCFPKGFRPIPNPKGTAPGFAGEIPVDRRGREVRVLCYAMPGPPVEMHEMFYHRILPELAALAGHNGVGREEYSCFLIPESKLEEVCNQHASDGILWGTRVQEHRISLYLTGGNTSARKVMAERIGSTLGTGLLSPGDFEAFDILSRYLEDRHLRMACAESCTGGLIAKLMTDRAGSSAWFWGGVVSYANEAKSRLLGVDSSVMEEEGAVSEATVIRMSEELLRISGADLSVSVSGIAGPSGGTEAKPVGTVWFGFSMTERPTVAVSLRFNSYGRASVRRRAAIAAILLAFFYANRVDLLDMVETWQYI